MHKTLKVFQLNVQKQRTVQHSVMNDNDLKDFSILALSEPRSFPKDGKVVTVPLGHRHWTKLLRTCQHEGRWAIRSMLWIRSGIECGQIEVPSADIIAALLGLPARSVVVASVYVEGGSADALDTGVYLLDEVVRDTRHRIGTGVDVVIAGEFDRHDQLWGGDDISRNRQGEADPIIDLMSEWSLRSLLP